MSPIRIVMAGGFLACYLEGGGHWAVFLQYLLGLRALGHDAWWLELLETSGDPARDRRRIEGLFSRFAEYGLADRCVVALAPGGAPAALRSVAVYGLDRSALEELARSADLLWNFAGWLRPPLLELFRHRVLIDLDPGHPRGRRSRVPASPVACSSSASTGSGQCPPPRRTLATRRGPRARG